MLFSVFKLSGLPLPPDPVITRWGTWIRSGSFLCQNFTKVEDFIQALEVDSKAVEIAKELVLNDDVKNEIYSTATYSFLPSTIEKLEAQLEKKEDQWAVFNEIMPLLDGFAKEKLQSSLKKNPDIINFTGNIDPEFRFKTMYAPLVSVDVERSFSTYKHILTDRRCNLTFANIEMLNVISFNRFLFDV